MSYINKMSRNYKKRSAIQLDKNNKRSLNPGSAGKKCYNCVKKFSSTKMELLRRSLGNFFTILNWNIKFNYYFYRDW